MIYVFLGSSACILETSLSFAIVSHFLKMDMTDALFRVSQSGKRVIAARLFSEDVTYK